MQGGGGVSGWLVKRPGLESTNIHIHSCTPLAVFWVSGCMPWYPIFHRLRREAPIYPEVPKSRSWVFAIIFQTWQSDNRRKQHLAVLVILVHVSAATAGHSGETVPNTQTPKASSSQAPTKPQQASTPSKSKRYLTLHGCWDVKVLPRHFARPSARSSWLQCSARASPTVQTVIQNR